jgi:hypothetical protein
LVSTSHELKELATEIETFLHVNKQNKRFQDYWQSQATLCRLSLESKLKKEQLEKTTDEQAHLLLLKQSEEEIELEKQAEELIEG